MVAGIRQKKKKQDSTFDAVVSLASRPLTHQPMPWPYCFVSDGLGALKINDCGQRSIWNEIGANTKNLYNGKCSKKEIRA